MEVIRSRTSGRICRDKTDAQSKVFGLHARHKVNRTLKCITEQRRRLWLEKRRKCCVRGDGRAGASSWQQKRCNRRGFFELRLGTFHNLSFTCYII